MINEKRFYTIFFVLLSVVVLMIAIPYLKNKEIDVTTDIEDVINVDAEMQNLGDKAKILENTILLDFISNYDNVKNPIENDKLRLNYLVENTSYLVENKNDSNYTYLSLLNSYYVELTKLYKITDTKTDLYTFLKYCIALVDNKKIEVEEYNKTYLNLINQTIEELENQEESTNNSDELNYENNQSYELGQGSEYIE